MSRETLWEILGRGEILPHNFNKDEEAARISGKEAQDMEKKFNAKKDKKKDKKKTSPAAKVILDRV